MFNYLSEIDFSMFACQQIQSSKHLPIMNHLPMSCLYTLHLANLLKLTTIIIVEGFESIRFWTGIVPNNYLLLFFQWPTNRAVNHRDKCSRFFEHIIPSVHLSRIYEDNIFQLSIVDIFIIDRLDLHLDKSSNEIFLYPPGNVLIKTFQLLLDK